MCEEWFASGNSGRMRRYRESNVDKCVMWNEYVINFVVCVCVCVESCVVWGRTRQR